MFRLVGCTVRELPKVRLFFYSLGVNRGSCVGRSPDKPITLAALPITGRQWSKEDFQLGLIPLSLANFRVATIRPAPFNESIGLPDTADIPKQRSSDRIAPFTFSIGARTV